MYSSPIVQKLSQLKGAENLKLHIFTLLFRLDNQQSKDKNSFFDEKVNILDFDEEKRTERNYSFLAPYCVDVIKNAILLLWAIKEFTRV